VTNGEWIPLPFKTEDPLDFYQIICLAKTDNPPLNDRVEFLFLDGISQKVREIGIEKKVMLCALAIHRKRLEEDQRHKEILSFQLAEVEDEASWSGFLADLKGRGLRGKSLKLILSPTATLPC